MNILLGTDSIKYPLTGIGRYALELANGLASSDNINKLYCYSKGHLHPYHKLSFNPSIALKLSRNLLKSIPLLHLLRQLYHRTDNILFRYKTRRAKINLYHSPNFLLLKSRIPSIATIHDLSFIHYPDFHPKHRVAYLQRNLPQTIKRAAHLITDSTYIRDEIMDYYNVKPEKISTIPLGVSSLFSPRSKTETMTTLQKHHLRHGQYFLSVATVEPRKNLSTLLKSFLQLPLEYQREYPLVLVGGSGWLNSDLHRRVATLQEQGLIKYLGYLPDSELYDIYASARVFALPSIYEGFGLPILEAMASGIPVLTSNASSIPEVSSDAAILVNPHDHNQITYHLKRLCEDDTLCTEMTKKGLENAKQYTWEACVQKTVKIYQQVL